MDYRKLLEYYLTSDEWDSELDFFFEGWQHRFDPYEDAPEKEHGKLYLLSDVYMEYSQKLQNAGGVFFDLHLTDEEFQRYFDVRYSSEQRFSILFGMWWGLREKQIALLSNLRHRKKCSKLLHYFLCNPNAEPAFAITEFDNFTYQGTYHVEEGDQ